MHRSCRACGTATVRSRNYFPCQLSEAAKHHSKAQPSAAASQPAAGHRPDTAAPETSLKRPRSVQQCWWCCSGRENRGSAPSKLVAATGSTLARASCVWRLSRPMGSTPSMLAVLPGSCTMWAPPWVWAGVSHSAQTSAKHCTSGERRAGYQISTQFLSLAASLDHRGLARPSLASLVRP